MRIAFPSLVGVLLLASMGAAEAQAYPTKPVRYICPFPAGGGVDIVTRIVGTKLSEIWGQPVIVDNRAGAGGTIGAGVAAKAPPDGYTLLMGGAGTMSIGPALYGKLPYDSIKDFAPIGFIGITPMVLVVHPSVPAKSTGELIAYGKSNPGKIKYASAGVGSILHLTMEMFRTRVGIDIVHVPYKGAAPAVNDLLGGHVLAMIGDVPLLYPPIHATKMRALAVTTTKRSQKLPDVPTVAESGFADFEATFWYATFTPAGVPRPIISRISADLTAALNAPEVKQRLSEAGVDIRASTPEQLAAFVRADSIKWAKVVKESGATAQ
jgi:tripartite-type tricarboxylate transporter receptor subunit TctC